MMRCLYSCGVSRDDAKNNESCPLYFPFIFLQESRLEIWLTIVSAGTGLLAIWRPLTGYWALPLVNCGSTSPFRILPIALAVAT